jgi:hypothetical protein
MDGNVADNVASIAAAFFVILFFAGIVAKNRAITKGIMEKLDEAGKRAMADGKFYRERIALNGKFIAVARGLILESHRREAAARAGRPGEISCEVSDGKKT